MKVADPSPVESKPPLQPSRGQARFAFSVLLVINILNYADRFVLPAILRRIQASPAQGGLGLTNFEAGLIGSSFLLVYALATLPIGVWADRGVRKNIVAICVGIWSIATVLAGITRNFLQLFLVRSVLGIGEAGYAPASLSLLGDFFPKEKRGRVLSYWSSGTLIGTAIGFSIGGLVADRLGWRWAFYVVGLPGLIAAFLIWRSLEPKRGAFDSEQEGEQDVELETAHGSIGKDFFGTVKQLLHIPTYWMLLGALTFSFFTIGGASFWLPNYFGKTFNLSEAPAGAISGAILVIGGLVGTIVGGWLADVAQKRRQEGRLLVSSLGLLLGAPLIFVALLIHTLPLFSVVFLLAAMFLSFCTGPLNAVIQDIIKPDLRASAVGFSLLFAHILGDASAPSLIGLLADKSSLNAALLVTAPTGLLIAGIVCLIGLRTVARDMRNMETQLHK